jgi:Ca2+-binding RTX toxin-like protein
MTIFTNGREGSPMTLSFISSNPKRWLILFGVVVALVVGVALNLTGAGAAKKETCGGKAATKVGTNEDDEIDGTNGDDVIVTKAGNDTVNGRRGTDYICGGRGNDGLEGNRGNDHIYGKQGSDTDLDGNRGNDTINGGTGRDEAEGGPGRDLCIDVEVPESCRLPS